MALNSRDRSRLIQAVCAWAEQHPEKHKAVLQIMGEDQEYSPYQIARALRDQTAVGQFLLNMFEHAAECHTPDFIATSFETMFAPPAPTKARARGRGATQEG